MLFVLAPADARPPNGKPAVVKSAFEPPPNDQAFFMAEALTRDAPPTFYAARMLPFSEFFAQS